MCDVKKCGNCKYRFFSSWSALLLPIVRNMNVELLTILKMICILRPQQTEITVHQVHGMLLE